MICILREMCTRFGVLGHNLIKIKRKDIYKIEKVSAQYDKHNIAPF